MSKAKIYKPCRSQMQSGKKNTKKWVLEFLPKKSKFIEPIMGWIGGQDMVANEVKLTFATKEQAENYAKKNQLEYIIQSPEDSSMNIKSYVGNFKK